MYQYFAEEDSVGISSQNLLISNLTRRYGVGWLVGFSYCVNPAVIKFLVSFLIEWTDNSQKKSKKSKKEGEGGMGGERERRFGFFAFYDWENS